MKLTEEQLKILESEGNIKINAVAGSGKTTTLIQYAKSKPRHAGILYLAFNQSVKKEAERKFLKEGLPNVRVETAHSLAFNAVVRGGKYVLKEGGGYKIHEIKDLLGLKRVGREKNSEYILANHIQKFTSYFCNQTPARVQKINYLDTVYDEESRDFVQKHYNRIEEGTRQFLAKMDKGEAEITHEFYLKKFQLLQPQLQQEYILFDEGQDASPVMLEVFLNQEEATKLIVGDAHQQIYGWRHATNALETVDFPNFYLSSSFRFNENIAFLANKYLAWKQHFHQAPATLIRGLGNQRKVESRANVARTNLSLLKKAIELVTDNKIDSLYFEGNIHSYTYATEGASIWDVLNLYSGKRNMIRDGLIRSMTNLEDLAEYCNKSEDGEMGMLIEIVNEYKEDLPKLINRLKEKHVDDKDKHLAEMVFSTVHRCKGMEYDEVTLSNDFITEGEIFKTLKENELSKINLGKLSEEINLLYVAVTRTRNKLNLPEVYFPKFENISLILSEENAKAEKDGKKNVNPIQNNPKSNILKNVMHKKEKRWSAVDDNTLELMFVAGRTANEMAKFLDRTEDAIHARVNKLGLRVKY